MAVTNLSTLSVLLISIVLCFLGVDSREDVPVFIWESIGNTKSPHIAPALSKITSEDFRDILMNRIDDKEILVVFVEENLSIEDFTRKDANGHTSFPHLQNFASQSKSVTYLPKVQSPVHGIRSLGDWQHVPFTQETWNEEMSHTNDSVLLIRLTDARDDEDRHHFLKRHDTFISKVYKDLVRKYDRVAAIYTARHASWIEEESFPKSIRSRRDIDVNQELNSTFLYNTTNILLLAHTIPVFNEKPLGEPRSLVEESSVDQPLLARLIITYDEAVVTLDFNELPSGYWVIDAATVVPSDGIEVNLKSSMIQAPFGFSYHCSQSVIFNTSNAADGTNDKQHLLFEGLQVQLFFTDMGEDEFRRFGDAYDCASFMTIGILSGYVVVILFALILGIGICMIMDIKTMDRFDDPKGKTITISATE